MWISVSFNIPFSSSSAKSEPCTEKAHVARGRGEKYPKSHLRFPRFLPVVSKDMGMSLPVKVATRRPGPSLREPASPGPWLMCVRLTDLLLFHLDTQRPCGRFICLLIFVYSCPDLTPGALVCYIVVMSGLFIKRFRPSDFCHVPLILSKTEIGCRHGVCCMFVAEERRGPWVTRTFPCDPLSAGSQHCPSSPAVSDDAFALLGTCHLKVLPPPAAPLEARTLPLRCHFPS